MNAKLTQTVDTNYKNGLVRCACGWTKDLGDGFNQYHIDKCPNCSDEITTRSQSQVTTGKPGNYKIKHGNFVYFVIENSIHVQFSGITYRTEYKKRIPN